MLKSFLLSISLVFTIGNVYGFKLASATLSFYSERIPVDYNTDLFISDPVEIKDNPIVDFYKLLDYSNYQVLLNDLVKYKEKFHLNDWLFYELINGSVKQLAPNLSTNNQTLIMWFLASKYGWNTRLAYTKDELFIYIQSDNDIFEVPMIEDGGKTFINTSHISRNKRKRVQQRAIYLLNFKPNPKGKPFQFILKELPVLKPITARIEVPFHYGTQAYRITVDIDKNIKKILSNYPLVAEKNYLRVGFSPTLQKSLITQFKTLLEDKTQAEGLSLIAAFTRTAFHYKEDNDYFGMSKPMIADEVFQYNYSDCEDRSALFFNLVKELYDLPMLVITYPDHLTIAVSFDCQDGDAIKYEGKNYYICDPTGPINSIRIGNIPNEYKNKKMTVIDKYR